MTHHYFVRMASVKIPGHTISAAIIIETSEESADKTATLITKACAEKYSITSGIRTAYFEIILHLLTRIN